MNGFRDRGFTLIEVLVSVVILSIGLLGLAGLQAAGLKVNHGSLKRSQAALMVYDIADRMRANRAHAGDYSVDLSFSGYGNPADQVQRDINEWLTALSERLPAGDGAISVENRRVTITVQWDDSRGAESAKQLVRIVDI